MADLLTHVLVVYALLTVASWQIDWVTNRWIVVGMCGGAIPDLVKIHLVLNTAVVEAVTGTEFTWSVISTLAGVLVIAGILTLLFETSHRGKLFWLLVTGGVTSLVVDGLRVFADGRANYWLYPVWWRPPTPSLYVTSDRRVLLVGLLVAAAVFALDRRLSRDSSGQ